MPQSHSIGLVFFVSEVFLEAPLLVDNILESYFGKSGSPKLEKDFP